MKELTKEQLIDLVFDRCNEIAIKNSDKFGQLVSDIVEKYKDNWYEMLVVFITTYGNEMRRICCQTFAEILYEILYSE